MAVTGTNSIETYRTEQFQDIVEMLVQQKGSKLRGLVSNEGGLSGKAARLRSQVGVATIQPVVTRHADTPLNPIPADGRWVFPTHYAGAELIDHADTLEHALSLEGPYARAFAMAMGRKMDTVLIDAALGNAQTGETSASTTTALPAGQQIANGGTALTIEKLRNALEIFEENDVAVEEDVIYAVITPRQKRQLLATTEITNADYNSVKALVNGQINTFMGFTFVTSTRLLGGGKYDGSLTASSNIESAIMFTPDGLGLGLWDDLEARVDERADKNYANQVYVRASFGATRLQEEKVVRVDSDKTA